jgi:hypothetical protein
MGQSKHYSATYMSKGRLRCFHYYRLLASRVSRPVHTLKRPTPKRTARNVDSQALLSPAPAAGLTTKCTSKAIFAGSCDAVATIPGYLYTSVNLYDRVLAECRHRVDRTANR